MDLLRLNFPRFYWLNTLYRGISDLAIRIDRPLLLFLALIGKGHPRVLMVDDDADDRELFTAAVRDIAPNVEVSTCRNGLELMRELHDESIALPDVIFLDLNMPFKSGQECLEEIRGTARLKSLPVIIYSTSTNLEYVNQTYAQGADYYLAKPDSFGDLKLITSKLFEMDWDTHRQPQKDKFFLSAWLFK
ncbi:MAG: response regulator [Bacteroidetes bacterium]|nr:response regulator [Bacteroidota bacterium]